MERPEDKRRLEALSKVVYIPFRFLTVHTLSSTSSTHTMLALVFLFLAAAEAGSLQQNRYYQVVSLDKSVHQQADHVQQQYRPEKPKHYQQDEEQLKFVPYSFGYVADGEDGGMSSRKESSDETGRVVGSYSLLDADGRTRKVDYVADSEGFRAKVETNEPGTKSDDPANVEFKSSAPEPQLDQQPQQYKPKSPQTYKQPQVYRPSVPEHNAPTLSYQSQPVRDEPKKSTQKHPKFLLVPYDGPWS